LPSQPRRLFWPGQRSGTGKACLHGTQNSNERCAAHFPGVQARFLGRAGVNHFQHRSRVSHTHFLSCNSDRPLRIPPPRDRIAWQVWHGLGLRVPGRALSAPGTSFLRCWWIPLSVHQMKRKDVPRAKRLSGHFSCVNRKVVARSRAVKTRPFSFQRTSADASTFVMLLLEAGASSGADSETDPLHTPLRPSSGPHAISLSWQKWSTSPHEPRGTEFNFAT